MINREQAQYHRSLKKEIIAQYGVYKLIWRKKNYLLEGSFKTGASDKDIKYFFCSTDIRYAHLSLSFRHEDTLHEET